MKTYAIALVALFVSGSAAAANLPGCPAPIKVGQYGCCGFYGDSQSIDTALFHELAARSGCSFRFIEMPRVRVWHELKEGTLDMTPRGINRDDRGDYSWFLPYLATKYLAVYRRSVASIDGPEAIEADDRLVIGVVRSFRHGVAIDALIDRIRAVAPQRIVEVADELSLIKLLKANRVNVIFAERYLADYAVGTVGVDDAAAVDIAPAEPPAARCLVLSKARFGEEEMSKWRALMQAMLADGTVDALLANRQRSVQGDTGQR